MPPSTVPPASPISQIPHEILLEIFTHCFPQYPLCQREPSAKTAPILLCHICSSWRRLALVSAPLWAHLSYEFTGVEVQADLDTASWAAEFQESDIEFITWWKTNRGRSPLSLNFSVPMTHLVFQTPGKSNWEFLLDYITSAQHLELDIFFWHWLLTRLENGVPFRFPNLHTALAEHRLTSDLPTPAPYDLLALLPPHALPALRRLSLSTVSFGALDFSPPAPWTALTHISLRCELALPVWQTLIRALPRLRWGHFDLIIDSAPFGIAAGAPPPPGCTLPDLRMLSLVVHCPIAPWDVFPLSFLFMELHLPAVRTLALSIPGAKAWDAPGALSELYTTLPSAPGITALALEERYTTVSLDTDALDAIPPAPASPPALLHPTSGPIWAHTPHLAHLQLDHPDPDSFLQMGVARRDAALAQFVRALFATWLDLWSAACPLRVMRICACEGVEGRGSAQAREAWAGAWAGDGPRVVLEIAEASAGLVTTDARMLWGARV